MQKETKQLKKEIKDVMMQKFGKVMDHSEDIMIKDDVRRTTSKTKEKTKYTERDLVKLKVFIIFFAMTCYVSITFNHKIYFLITLEKGLALVYALLHINMVVVSAALHYVFVRHLSSVSFL